MTKTTILKTMPQVAPALTFLISLLVLSVFDTNPVAEAYIAATAYVRACVVGGMAVTIITLLR